MTGPAAQTGRRVPVVSYLKLSEDGARGTFLGRKCRNCGVYFIGAPAYCQNCSSADLEPVELSTHGTLETYTIIYTPPGGWTGPVPYILGSVKLPEGPDILAEVIDCPKESVKIGMKMEMVTRVGGKNKEENEVIVYKWRPVIA